MKYFLDTEFAEGTQQRSFLGFKIGETKPTIDLISIGIVGEDRTEYYAISKDFNLKEAWNRYQLEYRLVDAGRDKKEVKIYWLRENVLYPIFVELFKKENQYTWEEDFGNIGNFMHHMERSGKAFDIFERLILRYGKTNSEIAREIICFCGSQVDKDIYGDTNFYRRSNDNWFITQKTDAPEFYADYCSYDWVVFCWLFGKMIDLPKGWPMYCNDIQQIKKQTFRKFMISEMKSSSLVESLRKFENNPDYPKQDPTTKHHALEDARYDRDLYNFLSKL